MIVYFAGVNTRHFCEAFIGRQVLETFTDPRQLKVYGRYRAVFKSLALDCGAYTELRSGVPVDLHAYADFCHEHGEAYDWLASVDSIQGGVDLNIKNWRLLSDKGLATVPTYHQGEPISVLQDYCRHTDRIGLGFSGRPIVQPRAFLDEAFSHIPSHVRVHGWAMTSHTARYPFASVDSTGWLRELLELRGCQNGQYGSTFGHLTDGELIEIIQKRYDRLPRMKKWNARPYAKQLGLLKESA